MQRPLKPVMKWTAPLVGVREIPPYTGVGYGHTSWGHSAYQGAHATHYEEHALADVTLLAPVARPRAIFGIGLNYAKHAAESGMQPPAEPVLLRLVAGRAHAHRAPGGVREGEVDEGLDIAEIAEIREIERELHSGPPCLVRPGARVPVEGHQRRGSRRSTVPPGR